MRYLALLRGINVSGHHMIKMDALKKTLEQIGFSNIETYIQSGNVFVDSEDDNAEKIGFQIKQEIYKAFGHDVAVIMVTKNELQECFKKNDFLNDKELDIKKLYVSFLSAELPENTVTQLNLNFINPDKIQLDGKKIYLKYAISPAKTRLDNRWIEKNMNVIATTRNWKTVTKLLEMY